MVITYDGAETGPGLCFSGPAATEIWGRYLRGHRAGLAVPGTLGWRDPILSPMDAKGGTNRPKDTAQKRT